MNETRDVVKDADDGTLVVTVGRGYGLNRSMVFAKGSSDKILVIREGRCKTRCRKLEAKRVGVVNSQDVIDVNILQHFPFIGRYREHGLEYQTPKEHILHSPGFFQVEGLTVQVGEGRG